MLYFIRASVSGAIKIGTAESPRVRLAQLQTGSPERLTLLGTVPGGSEQEARLHRTFQHLRTHGEWFRPDPALTLAIDAMVIVAGESKDLSRKRRRQPIVAVRSTARGTTEPWNDIADLRRRDAIARERFERVGLRVKHPSYGAGRIVGMETDRNGFFRARVEFEGLPSERIFIAAKSPLVVDGSD